MLIFVKVIISYQNYSKGIHFVMSTIKALIFLVIELSPDSWISNWKH